MSIPAGAWSETSEPKKLLTTRLKLISPRLIVTGSISSRTRRTSASPKTRPQPVRERGEQRAADPERGVAQVVDEHRELDHGADQDPDRVGVDLVVLGERGREADEHGDDRHVPEERRDREDAEAVVAVEHPDDHPRDPEQDQDREQQARERDGQVEQLALEPGREQRHDQRRERG